MSPTPATTFVRPPWHTPTANYAQLVEVPEEEPITLDEAKLLAGLDWLPGDPRDALMEGFISAARAKVEKDTGLALPSQTVDVFIVGADADTGLVPLPSQATPIQSITGLDAMTKDGERRSLKIEPFLRVTRSSVAVKMWPADVATFALRVVAGWPTAAALRREAPLLLHAVGLLTAHYATLGRDMATVEATQLVPYGYEESIAPYRLMWVP